MPSSVGSSSFVGFFCYSRSADKDDRSMSAFRAAIRNELEAQLGLSDGNLRIWQEAAPISDSPSWEDEAVRALNQSDFFIPLLTPSIAANPHCTIELGKFIERQVALGRRDRIFPIVYLPIPNWDDKRPLQDPLLSLSRSRQCLDWRTYRHHDLGELQVQQQIDLFCQRIAYVLKNPEEHRHQAQPSGIQTEDWRLVEAAQFAAEALARERRRRVEAEAKQGTKVRAGAEVEAEQERRRRVAEERRQEAEERRQAAPAERSLSALSEELESLEPRQRELRQRPKTNPAHAPVAATRPSLAQRPPLAQTDAAESQAPRDLLPLRYEGLEKGYWRLPILQRKLKSKSPAEVLGSVRVQRQSSKAGSPDNVDCSVFAPTAIRTGAEALVQVFLHIPEDAIVALGIAVAADASIDRQITHALNIPIEKGTRVEILLDPGGLVVPDGVATEQLITWNGQPTSCAFRVKAPRGLLPRSCHPAIRVAVDGTLVGCITFSVRCSLWARQTTPLLAGAAKAYRSAFVSYASQDRYEVLRRTQALRAAITVHQDVLDLDPGARWEAALYKWINEADLFLLCWSRAAKDSDWVMKEVRYALNRQRRSRGHLPDIVPLVLEPPSLAEPPKWLSHLYFNDALSSIVAVERADRA